MLTYVQRLQLDTNEKNTKMETNTAPAQELELDAKAEQTAVDMAARKKAAAERAAATKAAAEKEAAKHAAAEEVKAAEEAVKETVRVLETLPVYRYMEVPSVQDDETAKMARAAAEKTAAEAAEANKVVVQGVWADNVCKIVVQGGELTFNPTQVE